MTKRFSVTFERWDEESAEAGETDDRGYVVKNVSLTDAVRIGLGVLDPSWLDRPEPSSSDIDSARWLTFQKCNEGTNDYYTSGIEEQRALHIPDSVTESSRRRIARLFGLRA